MLTELLLAGALLAAPADSTARKSLAAYRIPAGEPAPAIDGRLDDAVWSRAQRASGFVQQRPQGGAAATEQTEAWIAYDDQAIYVAVRAHDTRPDSIAAQLGRRDDGGIYSDWIHLVFDSRHDRRSGYRFVVNPRGVKRDLIHFDDVNEDRSWDAVWDVATTIDADGWTAEFRIPFSQLRYRPEEEEQSWGINIGRDLARRDERTWWSPMPPGEPGFISRMGTLTGLERLRSPRQLEVVPYTVGSVTRAPRDPGNPFRSANDPFASAGADLKYGLTSDLTLTATFNPDFGQVEADPSQVNLSAFESFFSEQRPFFVEGNDIFRFGLGLGDDETETLFYSRRIGRAPQRGLSTTGERPFVDAPQQTRILGAAKLTGKVGGWSIGVLDAVTAETRTRYVLADDPSVHEMVSEPLTNHGVLRLRRDLRQGNSSIGTVATTTHRRIGEGLEFLPSAAYAAGLDFRHRFGGGNWEITGHALTTRVEGDSTAIQRLQRSAARYYQRPEVADARYDPLATALSGNAANLHLSKIGGGIYRGGAIALYRSGGFEANDLGFLREADRVDLATYGRWFLFRPRGVLRQGNLGWNLYSGWDTEGERAFTGANVNGSAQLTNLWNVYGGVQRRTGGLDTRGLRGGPALAYSGSWNGWGGISTAARGAVTYSLDGDWRVGDDPSSYSFALSPRMSVRASGRLTMSLQPRLARVSNPTQYVATRQDPEVGTRYVFATLDQTVASLTARLNYTFTPNLTLQLYGQPFVAAGGYGSFAEVDDPRAGRFADRYRPLGEELRACGDSYGVRGTGEGCGDGAGFAYRFGNPDFNLMQFRSNAVLRWEYRPGSTLFVVWSQGREHLAPDGTFSVGRDFGRLFGMDGAVDIQPTNVLMVKLSYWFDL